MGYGIIEEYAVKMEQLGDLHRQAEQRLPKEEHPRRRSLIDRLWRQEPVRVRQKLGRAQG